MTTGAANDIKQATKLVRKLICDYGMTEELGPLVLWRKGRIDFPGQGIQPAPRLFGKNRRGHRYPDAEIVEEQYARAKTILTEHRDELDRLGKALLEYEMLDREDIEKIIKGIIIEAPKKRVP